MLGCTSDDSTVLPPWEALPAHRDEEQVAKDVNRAFVHYPKGTPDGPEAAYESEVMDYTEGEKQLDKRKEELSDIIVEVLRRHPRLCYFQGYHDIVQVLYLVLGSQSAPPSVTRLSLMRVRDYMLPTLDPAIRHLELLPAIIKAADPVLYNHLPKIQPNYALGATLTLFSHVINTYGDITRLFDFFLASDTVVPLYFFASVLISRREELLEIEQDEDEAVFMVMLGKLPQPFDLESRISETTKLYNRFPPQSLRWPWWRISSSSVLKSTKTSYDVASVSLVDAQTLLGHQEREVRMIQAYQKAIYTARRMRLQAWRYRRPGFLGISIAIGLYALWLGRPHGGTPFGDLVRRVLGHFV